MKKRKTARLLTAVLAAAALMSLIGATALADPPDDQCPSPFSSDGHHTWHLRGSSAATCTQAGSESWQCADCNKEYLETIPALGHSWGAWTARTAGTETRTCSRCGAKESRAVATPKPAPPVITKNPTDETVTAGGSATFIANATGYTWCAWRFVSADGQQTVIFDKADPVFPGVKITGGNSTTLVLSDIPREMNGWKAVCLFSNAANDWVYTSGAVITVQEPTPTPSPTPEEATPTPTAEPTAEPTAAPETPVPETQTAEAAPSPELTPTPAPDPAPARDHTTAYLIAGVAAVALICGTVILLTLTKRRGR